MTTDVLEIELKIDSSKAVSELDKVEKKTRSITQAEKERAKETARASATSHKALFAKGITAKSPTQTEGIVGVQDNLRGLTGLRATNSFMRHLPMLGGIAGGITALVGVAKGIYSLAKERQTQSDKFFDAGINAVKARALTSAVYKEHGGDEKQIESEIAGFSKNAFLARTGNIENQLSFARAGLSIFDESGKKKESADLILEALEKAITIKGDDLKKAFLASLGLQSVAFQKMAGVGSNAGAAPLIKELKETYQEELITKTSHEVYNKASEKTAKQGRQAIAWLSDTPKTIYGVVSDALEVAGEVAGMALNFKKNFLPSYAKEITKKSLTKDEIIERKKELTEKFKTIVETPAKKEERQRERHQTIINNNLKIDIEVKGGDKEQFEAPINEITNAVQAVVDNMGKDIRI